MSSANSILVTGGAGFIGSNLVLTLQERMPNARLTVIDDFSSGDFKNLAGYLAAISSRKISPPLIGNSNSEIPRPRDSTRFSTWLRSRTPPCTISSSKLTTTWRAFAAF